MKKTTAILCMVAALLVGVAVTVYAQSITWVKITLKWDNTTTIPALGGQTQWVYAWHQVADAKEIPYAECDARCRRQIVGEMMMEQFRRWQYARIAAINSAAAEATTAAQIEALQGTVEAD